MTDELTRRTLARNDRFLREFVEKLEMCPFARKCRETGGLERRVLALDEPVPGPVLEVMRELSDGRFDHVEVALLILPNLSLSFLDFTRFVSTVRTLRDREQHGASTYYAVAFHPDSPPLHGTPSKLVSLLRRSPDPTIQLVRREMLDSFRGPDTSDTIYVPIESLDDPLPERTPNVSERIALQNHETAQRVGVEALLAILEGIRRG